MSTIMQNQMHLGGFSAGNSGIGGTVSAAGDRAAETSNYTCVLFSLRRQLPERDAHIGCLPANFIDSPILERISGRLPSVADLAPVSQHQGQLVEIGDPEVVDPAGSVLKLARSTQDVGRVVSPQYGDHIRVTGGDGRQDSFF